MLYQVNYSFQFPIRLIYGYLNSPNEKIQLPTAFPAKTEWGEMLECTNFAVQNVKDLNLEISWISIKTGRTFYFRGPLNLSTQIINNNEITLLIGLGPSGEIAIWLNHEFQRILFLYAKGIEITEKITDDMISKANFINSAGKHIESISELCEDDITKFCLNIGLESESNCHDFLSNKMKRFNYRYCLKKISSTYSIYEWLSDTTYCKFNNSYVEHYHLAAKPIKLAVEWNDYDDSYSIYFWLNEDAMTRVFENFYGAHPDTKTDFIIRIDAENKIYELALYRYGLKEPLVIPVDVYQLLVFKNKFEDYRSDNYNQEQGAWIW